jgi:hypothetical protein
MGKPGSVFWKMDIWVKSHQNFTKAIHPIMQVNILSELTVSWR